MYGSESIFSVTGLIVLAAFGLQVWVLLRTARSLSERLPLALFVASLALAARGGAVLAGLIEPALMGEIVILAAAGALLAACYLQKPTGFDLDQYSKIIVERTPKPIMIKDNQGRYMYVNAAFEDAFDVKSVEVLGRIAEDIWDHNLSQAAIDADHEVRKTGEPSTHKVVFTKTDGEARDWLIMKFSMPMPDGQICIATVYTDFTEHVDLERRLAETEARIQTLLDNSPAPIYFKDREMRFVMVNRRYLEVYGVTLEQVLGKTSFEIFDDGWGPSFMAHDQEVLDKMTMVVHEESVNDATFLTSKFPILDAEGNLIGVGGIETDITERVAVERAFRLARDEAEMANRSKSAFLANMSHELRTPLNSIIGFSDSLLEGTLGEIDNPMHREYLAIIRTGGEHLLHLINDILDLSRIEAGKLELEETPVAIHETFSESIRLTAERAGFEGIYINNRIAADLPKVMADERQLKQVLINLLSNAIKFTNPGGQITASAMTTETGGIEIRIEDTGVGIDAESLKTVQQPFVQVADAMTRKHQGSGLGLAIVRSIIELHEGTFTLESTVGKGTTAIIVFPKSRVMSA